MNGQMDRYTVQLVSYIDTYRWMDEWIDRWMDKWIDDECTDG